MADILLRFTYSGSSPDLRTFKVYQVFEGLSDELELYRFYHPMTGLPNGTTTFHRKNLTTLIFETAGQIEWSSNNSNATVYFGIDEASLKDIRRVKNSTSKSRRFKAGGSEYKWKIAENGTDLYCVDSHDNEVATWTQAENILRVSSTRGENILDRLIVTCLMNLWFKQMGRW